MRCSIMRISLIALPLLLAATACAERPQYILIADTPTARTDAYAGSKLDQRGYRVDAGSYMSGISTDGENRPMSQAQVEARERRIATSRSRNPEAWNHNGYHYDQWGNLIRVDR
jgi:hypothetical protein